MSEDQHKWAAELRKHKTKKKTSTRIPIQRRHEDTGNKTEYYKILLQKSIDEDNVEDAKQHFEKLVDLRIEQMHHNLELIYNRFGLVPEVDREQEIEYMHKDCARLAAGIDYLFETKHLEV